MATGPSVALARPDTERPEWNGLLPRTLFARLERRPVIGAGVRALGDGLRASMDHRTLELIALRVSARRDCLYVWRGHCRIAHLHIDETLTLTDIARVAAGPHALTGRDAT